MQHCSVFSICTLLTINYFLALSMLRPYKKDASVGRIKDADNLYEMLLLLMLSCLSITHLVFTDVPGSDAAQTYGEYWLPTLYALVTVVSLVIACYRFGRSWKSSLERRPRNTAQGVCLSSDSEDEHSMGLTSNPVLQLRRNRSKEERPRQASGTSMSTTLDSKEVSGKVCSCCWAEFHVCTLLLALGENCSIL